MIYLPGRFVFVHIPRTGGISIESRLYAGGREGTVWGLDDDRHTYGHLLRERLGEAWDRSYRFSVIRDPWQTIESDYRLTFRHWAFWGEEPDLTWEWRRSWRERVLRMSAATGFEAFVRREILGSWSPIVLGGYWRTWCMGAAGEDLGIEPVRFEELAAKWPEIARRCGLNSDGPLPHLNATRGRLRLNWTPYLLDAVSVLCRGDIERFGFLPPPVIEEAKA